MASNDVTFGGAAKDAKNGVSSQLSRLTTVETGKMLTIMKVLNVINMMCVATLGVLSFARLSQITTGAAKSPVQRFFVAGYTTIFSILLLIFELRCTKFDGDLRKKCGFLYSFLGKTLFIFFIATLCFGYVDASTGISQICTNKAGKVVPCTSAQVNENYQWVGYVVGGITVLNGLFNMFILYSHPGFRTSGVGMDSQGKGAPAAGVGSLQAGSAGYMGNPGPVDPNAGLFAAEQAGGGASNGGINPFGGQGAQDNPFEGSPMPNSV